VNLVEGTKRIIEAIGRKKGRFAFGATTPEMRAQFQTDAPFMLAVGAWKYIKLGTGGAVCTVAMTREHVQELRDMIDEALGEAP
jgi:hypothetical protein